MGRNLPKLDGWEGQLKEIVTMDGECKRYASVFDTKVQKEGIVSLDSKLVGVHAQISEIIDRLGREDKENDIIINWVSKVDMAFHRHHSIRNQVVGSYENTGQWLKSHSQYQDWKGLSGDGHVSALFLRGPGMCPIFMFSYQAYQC